MWKSSNPVLTHSDDAFREAYGHMDATGANQTTLGGVVNRTFLLVLLTVCAGAGGYALLGVIGASAIWIGSISAFITVLAVGFLLTRKAHLAPYLAPVYAIVEGVFLGALTALADQILASRGLTVAGGVGLQAFIVTMSAVISMLVLYKLGVRPTRMFMAVIGVATAAIMLAYLVSFIMMIVLGQPLPLISFASAVADKGVMGFLGLGINIFILIVASLWLIIDFKMVEDAVEAGEPKYMEWYLGFALLVTLAWIYYEAVKLVVRLAVLFGGRD